MTAAAVVAFFGSAVVLLMGLLMAWVTLASFAPTPIPKQLGIGIGLMFAAFAVLGITTGVALLRMRQWARIAMLIFAGALALFSAFGVVIIAVTPLPPTVAVGSEFAARAAVSVVYAVPLAIGVWWLILFTRRGIMAAFVQPGDTGAAPKRPLMVTIIAYWIIVGGAGTILMSFMGLPAFIAGFVVQGWGGAVVYLALGALNLYAGRGLLKLQEAARQLTMALFGLSIVQVIAVAASPATRQKITAAQRALAGDTPPPTTFDASQMTMYFMAVGAVIAAVSIWLLVRDRAAFQDQGQQQA